MDTALGRWVVADADRLLGVVGDICDFQVGSGLASRRVGVKVGGAVRSYCVTGGLKAEEVLG